MRRHAVAALSVVCLVAALKLAAQSPIALPYTMTTLGGTSPMAGTAGTQCPNLPAGVVSTDAFGDGCLAVNGIFGNDPFSGLVVDAFGNVFVNDDIKGALHMINPNSGIMTLVAGGGTACSSKVTHRATAASHRRERRRRQSSIHVEWASIPMEISCLPAITTTLCTSSVATLRRFAVVERLQQQRRFRFPLETWAWLQAAPVLRAPAALAAWESTIRPGSRQPLRHSADLRL